ncbi:uncharacterized protein LOC62_01G000363 [Vanrija pseudolonga]|uniref:Uncharacterized protein n=1 Tax=Vanrija pseudolonga TaxID=143232 RepID=A0AAF0Y358_9TREE|nr:hypothetical protein LOC62_01G000363 [Vanrija pseudolonga]
MLSVWGSNSGYGYMLMSKASNAPTAATAVRHGDTVRAKTGSLRQTRLDAFMTDVPPVGEPRRHLHVNSRPSVRSPVSYPDEDELRRQPKLAAGQLNRSRRKTHPLALVPPHNSKHSSGPKSSRRTVASSSSRATTKLKTRSEVLVPPSSDSEADSSSYTRKPGRQPHRPSGSAERSKAASTSRPPESNSALSNILVPPSSDEETVYQPPRKRQSVAGPSTRSSRKLYNDSSINAADYMFGEDEDGLDFMDGKLYDPDEDYSDLSDAESIDSAIGYYTDVDEKSSNEADESTMPTYDEIVATMNNDLGHGPL